MFPWPAFAIQQCEMSIAFCFLNGWTVWIPFMLYDNQFLICVSQILLGKPINLVIKIRKFVVALCSFSNPWINEWCHSVLVFRSLVQEKEHPTVHYVQLMRSSLLDLKNTVFWHLNLVLFVFPAFFLSPHYFSLSTFHEKPWQINACA